MLKTGSVYFVVFTTLATEKKPPKKNYVKLRSHQKEAESVKTSNITFAWLKKSCFLRSTLPLIFEFDVL